MAVCPSIHDLLFCGSQPISLDGPLLDTSVLTGEAVATPNQDIKKSDLPFLPSRPVMLLFSITR